MVTARIPLFRNTVIEKGGYNTKRSLASSFRKKKNLRGLTLESAKMDMLKKTNITQDFRLRLHAKNLNLFQRRWATAKINYLGIELNSHISISIATEKNTFPTFLHTAAWCGSSFNTPSDEASPCIFDFQPHKEDHSFQAGFKLLRGISLSFPHATA